MNRQLRDALEACLQAMEKGESMDAVLRRFPSFAAELRPLLEAARASRTLDSGSLPGLTVRRSRVRVLAAASRLRKAPRRRSWRAWQIAVTVTAVLAILLASTNGLLIVSARALPGDALYPLKLTVENTQLQLAVDPAQKQALIRQFQLRRVEETESLLSQDRVVHVEFGGTVAAKTDDGVLVEGIPVVITNQTQITAPLSIGSEVTVSGQTHTDGHVQADALISGDQSETEGGSPAESSPTPESTRVPDKWGGDQATGTWSSTQSYQGDHERYQTPVEGGTPSGEWSGASTPEPTDGGGDH